MIIYETSLVLLGFGSAAMRLYDHNPAVGYSGPIQFREERTGEFFFRSKTVSLLWKYGHRQREHHIKFDSIRFVLGIF